MMNKIDGLINNIFICLVNHGINEYTLPNKVGFFDTEDYNNIYNLIKQHSLNIAKTAYCEGYVYAIQSTPNFIQKSLDEHNYLEQLKTEL